jgi:hypothetical protein
MNRNELLIQQFANQERKQQFREEKLNNELEILTQINDSLEQATKKKQHLIYKQRHVVNEALKEQNDIKSEQRAIDKFHRLKSNNFFPFTYQEEIERKQA